MAFLILLLATLFLAYANGANDNFKGVATLYGSGQMPYRTALIWATVAQLLGSAASIFWAAELVKNFSGKGLVPDDFLAQPAFAASVALGAAATVFFATRIGMPISTTHGLVGGLVGAGLMAIGSGLNFDKLGKTFLLPLLVSPLLSALLAFLIYSIGRAISPKNNEKSPENGSPAFCTERARSSFASPVRSTTRRKSSGFWSWFHGSIRVWRCSQSARRWRSAAG